MPHSGVLEHAELWAHGKANSKSNLRETGKEQSTRTWVTPKDGELQGFKSAGNADRQVHSA